MTIAIDEIKDGGRETIRLIVLDNVQPERKAFNRAVNEWIFKNRPDLQPSGINGRGFYAYQLLTTVQPMSPEAIKQAFETCLQNAREAFEKGNYGTCGGFLELGIPILFGQGLRGGFLRQINEILMRDGAKIDFERIVSCVNAMEGLNPEGIKELIRCAETVVKSPKHDLSDKIIDLKSALAKVIP